MELKVCIFYFSDLPAPAWIGGQSKPKEKWVYYGSDEPIPVPPESDLTFPPWLCVGKPTYTGFLSVATWGYGWRVYEGKAADKFVVCAEPPGVTSTKTTSVGTTRATTTRRRT